MAYVPNSPAWNASSNISAARLNHLQEQYDEIVALIVAHNHDGRYYTKLLMDSYFWTADNDGPGSGLDADLLEGVEGDAVSSGIDYGVIGFWYGTAEDFSGKLLTGYLNWHIADGSEGAAALTDLFPIGSILETGTYARGSAVGALLAYPLCTVTVLGTTLDKYQVNHFHPLYDWQQQPCHPNASPSHYGVSYIPVGWMNNSMAQAGGDTPIHGHDGSTYASEGVTLLPPFKALIPIQYGYYDGNWHPDDS